MIGNINFSELQKALVDFDKDCSHISYVSKEKDKSILSVTYRKYDDKQRTIAFTFEKGKFIFK